MSIKPHILLCLILVAGPRIAPCQQLQIQKFGVAQGLPQMQVNCLAEDAVGRLWLGTVGGGVASFDGATFRTYSKANGLASNLVQDILVDGNRVWVSTEKGISCISRAGIRNYSISMGSSQYPDKLFLSRDTLYFTLLNSSRIGMVLNDTIYPVVDQKRWSGIRQVRTLDGTTIFTRQGRTQELFVLRANRVASYATARPISSIFSVFRDRTGETLISTDAGLYQLQEETLRSVLEVGYPIFREGPAIGQFVGMGPDGLVETNGQVETPLSSFSLPIFAHLVDDGGIFWFGTDRGLYKLTFNAFEKVIQEIEDPVTCLYRDGDDLWLGSTTAGVRIYRKGKLLRSIGSLTDRSYTCAIKRNREGVFYIAGSDGMMELASASSQRKPFHPDVIPGAISFDFDEAGNMLIAGAHRGLYWYDRAADKVFVLESDESIWSVTYNARYKAFFLGSNSGLKRVVNRVQMDLPKKELEDAELHNLDWLSPDVLLVGSVGKGVFLYSVADTTVSVIDESRGLASNSVFFVRFIRGKIWVGTEKGIDMVTLSGRGEVERVEHYDESDGLIGLETNLDAVYFDDSTIMVGAISGAYRYTPADPVKRHPLHISNILVYNKPWSGLDSARTDAGQAVFSNEQNHLTFEFSQIDKRKPQQVYYSYILEGFDHVWSKPGRGSEVTFSNLPPGAYRFRVIATDKAGYFTHDQVDFRFVIQPAFYQTSWFRVIVSIAILAIVTLVIYRYNNLRLSRALKAQHAKDLERAALRKEIARDFHDELGNQVARMINLVSLMRINQEIRREAYTTLNEYAQAILNGTRDFVWALDPANDDLGSVVVHLKDFGERMFHEKGIAFAFFGDATQSIKVPPGYSRQLNLIYKEAMTNAFRHSGATRVDFSVTVVGDAAVFVLRDNGHGFSTDTKQPVRGLENMRVRAGRMNAELTITSGDTGTTVQLRVLLHPTES